MIPPPSLPAIWDRLKRVSSLRFTARSESRSGWNGVGTGLVAVDSSAESSLTFTEAGTFQPASGTATRFTNAFRWSLLGELLRLEHLRFGPENPVHLFDLAPAENGLWSSAKPHHCRDDCYSATLRLADWGIEVQWTVAGPQKQERIEYEYR